MAIGSAAAIDMLDRCCSFPAKAEDGYIHVRIE